MADTFIQITSENFDEQVAQAQQMVLLLLYKEGSTSCQIQLPELDAISKEYRERITFARLDVDAEPEITTKLAIDGVPTLLFLKYGQEIYRIKGIMMRDKLRRQLEGVLLSN